MKEWRRRQALPGSPDYGSADAQEFDQEILNRAANPILSFDVRSPDENEVK